MFFFKGNIGQEKLFYHILERKNAFLGYKIKKLKSGKIVNFPRGIVHAFGQKLTIFPSFFLRRYSLGKCVFRYSKTKKTCFLATKQEL